MSEDQSVFILFVVILWVIFALFGAYVASQKNRAGMEGLILGFLFGPLGVLIEALLPTLLPREDVRSGYARGAQAGARQRHDDQLAELDGMTGTERRDYEREVRNAEKRRQRDAWRARRGIE